MTKREDPLLPEGFFHIYNRGNNKGLLFFSDRNYQFFIERLFQYLAFDSNIIAYCLMPNHFHLLLKVNSTDFTRKNLQLFLMSYVKSINKEQNRTGSLFQGRFQAKPVEDGEHLLDCVRYIHLNPVTAGLVKNPALWPYSSYYEYLHPKLDTKLNTSLVMEFFANIADFQVFSENSS